MTVVKYGSEVSFTYLGSIISKYGGSGEHVKSRIAKAQVFFHHWKSLEE